MSLKIKYAKQFLIELIKKNPVKTVTLFLTLIFFYFAGSLPSYVKNIKIEKTVKVDTGWVYIYSQISENKIKYELIHSDVPLKIENSFYSKLEYHEANFLLWVLFTVGCLIFISGTFSDEGWGVSDVSKSTLNSLITCEYENGEYLYFIEDRLIGKTTHQIQQRRYL